MQINSISIFEANKAKGFWDKPRLVGICCDLIISELSEALEAERQGRHCLMDLDLITINVFEQTVKDTVEDEIADAIIRLHDLRGAVLSCHTGEETPELPDFAPLFGVGAILVGITQARLTAIAKIARVGLNFKQALPEQGDHAQLLHEINHCLLAVYSVAKSNLMHLDQVNWHVAKKLEYNASRPSKHGKLF